LLFLEILLFIVIYYIINMYHFILLKAYVEIILSEEKSKITKLENSTNINTINGQSSPDSIT